MKSKLFLSFLLFTFSISVIAQQSKIDSLQAIISINKQDTNTINALTTLAALIRNNEMDKAIQLSTKAIQLSNKLNYTKGKGLANLNIGTINHIKGNYDTALVYYNNALNYFKQVNLKKNIAKCYNNMGNLYQLKADYSKAIEQLMICKKIGDELKDNRILSDCELNTGNVYFQKKEYEKAIAHYSAGLVFAEKLNEAYSQAQYLNNIGAAQRMLNQSDLALENYKKSLAIRYKTKDLVGIAENTLNIGDVYFTIANYDSAFFYFKNAYKQYEEIGLKTGVAYSLNNIGGTLFKLNKKQQALDTLYKTINLATELGLRDLKVEAYKSIAEALYELKKYKESADYMGKLLLLKDSLLNEESIKQITEMQTKYESEKKDKEIIKQTAEIKTQQIESDKQAAQRNVLIVGLVLLIAVALFIFRGYKQKKLANEIITIQKQEVEIQKHIIEEKHKEITDSINYAERIQRSFLATKELLDENLNDYFVLFQPKDVVSGDFYWATKLSNGNFTLATADSTGHGVPGAIMSLLNITSLESAIKDGLTQPAEILNATRKTIIERLKKDGSTEGGKDGMDCSLTIYDFNNKKLFVTAANNPVWIVRGTEVIEIKPDKMPVGKHDKQDVLFTQHEIDLQNGDVVYTLTDGFPDQFGGETGKKFMSKRLRELLVANANLHMQAQKELLQTTFKNWVGGLEQVDDVCIIGVRV